MWCSSFETHTHSHLYSALVERREKYLEKEEDQALISLLVLSFIFWGIYIEEDFAGFFPLGFSQDKYLCSPFVWLCLSIF